MGIYAKGEQLPATRVSDTPQDRYGELADPNDMGGGALGQVIADTKATATSANDTAGVMANDLSALESRVDGIETNGAPPTAHTHPSVDITNTAWQIGREEDAGKVVKTHGTNGWVYSYSDPTSPNHLARKGYVDQQVGNHTHLSADIGDKAVYAELGTPAGRVIQTGSDGFIHSRTNPTSAHHLTRKGYVDEAVTTASNTLNTRIGAVEEVTSTSGTGWSAYKRAGVVTLTLMGVTSGFTLPTGWRPPLAVYSPMAPVRPGTDGYFTISTGGVVSLYDATDSVYSTVTYITA